MTVRGRVDGMLGRFISGWAVPAHGRHCAITVQDAKVGLIARGKANQERADLADLGLGRNDFAFSLELPGCEQRRAFHVFADGEELAGSPLLAGPGQYDGDCMMDHGVLKGWVRERTPELRTHRISVMTQHGEMVGEGRSAPALAAFPNCAGFSIELSNAVFGAGELRLRVLADGTPFTECACELPLQGSIDLITPQTCAGWLLAPDAPPQRRLEIEIFRNGEPVAMAPCTMPRPDLRELFPEKADAGFAASFPLEEARQMQPVLISLRLRGSPVELFGGPHIVANREAAVITAQHAARQMLAALGPAEKTLARAAFQQFLDATRSGQGFSAALGAVKPAGSKPRISIIIPVYGDIAATRSCIDSVLRHRCAATDRVILINDASPEPGMAAMLNGYVAQPDLFILTNPENRGFIHSVNRGFAFAGSGDMLLLNADTVVFPGVFDELCAIARAAPEIGTVTPLSNDATIFSYPDPQGPPEDLADCTWAELAAAALERNAGRYVEVPTAHGFCMLIKEETLQAVGRFDPAFGRGYGEENDFCQRATDLGYKHAGAAGVLVWHGGSVSFGGEKEPLLRANSIRLSGKYPEYFPRVREFIRRDGLRAARWALDTWRLERARQHDTEFVLVISNNLAGGTAKAIADMERAEGDDAAIRLRLNCLEDGGAVLAGQIPLFRAGFAEDEMPALFELLDAAAPNRVIVHQFLGFPTAFLQRLAGWLHGRASTFYLHDFYPLCPRVTLIDAAGDYCAVAEPGICARCIAVGGAHANSRIAGLTPTEHRALFGSLISSFGEVIAPSESAAALLRRGLPRVAVRVVPHPETDIPPPGRAAGCLQSLHPPVRAAADAHEIVLFGALGPHKGSGKLLEIARRARLTHPTLLFRMIGYTNIDEELLPLGNVIISGRYEPEMLDTLAEEARGRYALFLHEWPETWSYTLSEALSHGFVPLVPDLGAPAERVRALGYGVVYPFPASAAGILRVIETVLASGGAGGLVNPSMDPATRARSARRRAGE